MKNILIFSITYYVVMTSSYKKRSYKKQLVEFIRLKKRQLVDFQTAKKRVS